MRALLVVGLIAIAVVNISLFPWLNGDGFVQSRDGFWSLRPQERGDFAYLVETNPHPSIVTLTFYLRLGEQARGSHVTVPPELLDAFLIQAIARGEAVLDSSYEPELDPEAAEMWRERQHVSGTLRDGTDWEIFLAHGADRSRYRAMTYQGTILMVPEPTPEDTS